MFEGNIVEIKSGIAKRRRGTASNCIQEGS
jgi:hypothetical protein